MSEKGFFNITVEDRRKRPELTLPFSITYHHLDRWMPNLGRDAFLFWLQMFTFANRRDFDPKANIIDYSYKFLAKKAEVSKYKLTVMLKNLYEYGLLEIVEVDSQYKTKKQLYKVLTVPIYADTVFCELRKCRSWEERNSFGQKQNKIIIAKRSEESASSQSEIQTSSNKDSQSENRTGSQFNNQTSSQSENQTAYNSNNIINKNTIKQQHKQHEEEKELGGSCQEQGDVVDNASLFYDQEQQQPRNDGNDLNDGNEYENSQMRRRVLKEAERLELPVNDYVADQVLKSGEGDIDRILDAMKAAAQWTRGKEQRGEKINNWCGVLVKAVVDERKPVYEGRKDSQSKSHRRNIPRIDPETGMVIVNS